MPDKDEQIKERSKLSLRIGDVQVELEGTYDDIHKLMGKDLFDFTKGLQEPKKPLPSSTEIKPEVTPKAPEVTPKAAEITPKEKTVPPPSKPSTTAEVSAQPSRVPTIGKAPEKRGSKKIFGKTMVITLGVICIILAAGLVGAIAVYMPMVSTLESQIAEKDNTIVSLNSQVSSLTLQVSSLGSQILSLQDSLNQTNTNIAALQQAILFYRNIVYLNASEPLVTAQTVTQNANTSTIIYNDIRQYAGYVSVNVESSSNTTYAQVTYSSYGANYNNTVTVGTSGTAVFPVLPGEIEVRVGNTESAGSVTATVTAIYRY